MKNRLPTHDDFIRHILSDIRIARTYFRNYLPSYISSRLDFSTLTQLPGTYLSDDLKKSVSDIVYSCKLKGSEVLVKISLLIEHKSYPDKYTPIQIGTYIYSALAKQVKNKEDLRLVIPVLLYHGRTKWEYHTLDGLFEGIPEEWKKFVPDFDYVFNNLGTLSNREIESLNNKFLAASFLALKHSHLKEWLEENAVDLLLLASEGSKGLRKSFILYLYSRGNLEEKVLNSLPETIQSEVMNTLDIYFEKGIEKGIEKGRAEGIEKGRMEGIEKGKEQVVRNLIAAGQFTISQIAGFTNLPESFIRKVRNNMKRK